MHQYMWSCVLRVARDYILLAKTFILVYLPLILDFGFYSPRRSQNQWWRVYHILLIQAVIWKCIRCCAVDFEYDAGFTFEEQFVTSDGTSDDIWCFISCFISCFIWRSIFSSCFSNWTSKYTGNLWRWRWQIHFFKRIKRGISNIKTTVLIRVENVIIRTTGFWVAGKVMRHGCNCVRRRLETRCSTARIKRKCNLLWK